MKSDDLQKSLNTLRDVYMPADRDREISTRLQQEIDRHRSGQSQAKGRHLFRQWGGISAAVGIAMVLFCVAVTWHKGRGVNQYQAIPSTSRPLTSQAAHVTVYQPFIGGAHILNPQITTYVEPPKGSAKTLKVYVNLSGGMDATPFPPATLHVTSEPSDIFSYTKDYQITRRQTLGKEYILTIPVPPKSGKYAVSVSLAGGSPTTNHQPMSTAANGGPMSVVNRGSVTLFVDHGGYYRTAVVPVNQTINQGNIAVTLTQVVMKQDATRVELHITGTDSHKDLQLLGNFDHATRTFSNGQTDELPFSNASLGPAMTTPRQGELDYEPMTGNVKELHLDFEFLIGPSAIKTKPFTFNIPLDK